MNSKNKVQEKGYSTNQLKDEQKSEQKIKQ